MRTNSIVALLASGWLVGCGASPLSDATPDAGTQRVGAVDLSQAPETLAMTCDDGVGAVALAIPCLVGFDVTARGEMVPGIHATECRLAVAGSPLAWSFLLPLAQVAANPELVVQIPGGAPSVPVPGFVTLGANQARFSGATGALSFSRVDPVGRAFAGAFEGRLVFKSESGPDIACDIAGPLWGAPGNFL